MKISEATDGPGAASKALETRIVARMQALEATVESSFARVAAQLRTLTGIVGAFWAVWALLFTMAVVATCGPPIQKMLGH